MLEKEEEEEEEEGEKPIKEERANDTTPATQKNHFLLGLRIRSRQ